MSRIPSSFVAPHTPAWVVTGAPSSRATSKAARSGNAGSPVTSKAIWNPSISSPAVKRRLTKSRNGGVRVVGRLQAVRPVDGRGHPGVERLDRREQVTGVDVHRAELPAVFEVV